MGYVETLIGDVNLELSTGKLIALIGDNGSGKSTLMKTLLGLIKPLRGDIFFNQKNIQEFSAKEWSGVFSAVFSRLGQIPEIRVRELIDIGSNNKNSELKNDIVNWLNIADLLHEFATQISDGQLQKVMIARALMQDTPFVIFDEPTAHLDYKNKSIVFDLLRNLVKVSGKTFIVITHEILHALHLSDEIWYIHNRKLYHGTPESLENRFSFEKEILKFTHDRS
ncbi:MAG: ATP-binding cassette domain-containing protein [Flavobacteriaceae bacterium]|nr:ATP-binding cassette domain-containing protein [Flavobacteriaceae bacterium]